MPSVLVLELYAGQSSLVTAAALSTDLLGLSMPPEHAASSQDSRLRTVQSPSTLIFLRFSFCGAITTKSCEPECEHSTWQKIYAHFLVLRLVVPIITTSVLRYSWRIPKNRSYDNGNYQSQDQEVCIYLLPRGMFALCSIQTLTDHQGAQSSRICRPDGCRPVGLSPRWLAIGTSFVRISACLEVILWPNSLESIIRSHLTSVTV